MGIDVAKPLAAFGFLTVVEDSEHGFFGGYLVVSEMGRPLEFRCSTPVQPSQAQKILYGATLRSYVSGELIGQTLLDETQLAVQAILTDRDEVMSLATVCDQTLVCLSEIDPSADVLAEDTPELILNGYRLVGNSECDWRPETLRQTLLPLAARIDLAEPFDRIREAIREAQRAACPETDDDLANSTAA